MENNAPQSPFQSQNPVEQSMQQVPSMGQSAPVSPSSFQSPPVENSGSKKLLWVAIVFVVIVLIGLGAWYFMVLNQANNVSTTGYTQPIIETPTTTPTPTAEPTPTPIQSTADLNGALGQIDDTNTSATTELNQNTTDSTSFSQ